MINKFILPVLGVFVLALAVVSIARTQPRPARHDPPSSPPRSRFASRVAAVGLVEANTENVSLGAHVSGVVERLHVKVGDRVRRGDPLVKLDTRQVEALLAEARAMVGVRQAALVTARARVQTAEASLADVQRLLRIAEATDPRSISVEEVTRRRSAVEIAQASLGAARSEVGAAEAGIAAAEAGQRSVEVQLERSTVFAPLEGDVLQVKVRPGEFVNAGLSAEPWLVLGNVQPLHVRADVDEHEAWRVNAAARAEAQVRGNSALSSALEFVRFEPLVLPKRSLTGEAVERVDTRVLQVLYRVLDPNLRLFVGQQMDVFIEVPEVPSAASK